MGLVTEEIVVDANRSAPLPDCDIPLFLQNVSLTLHVADDATEEASFADVVAFEIA